MRIISESLRHAVCDLCVSLNIFSSSLPRETTYELLHALTHMLVGYHRGLRRDEEVTARKDELTRALGHIRRAHLDYLKILLAQRHQMLQSAEGPSARAAYAVFVKELAQARLNELYGVGTTHEPSIKRFRDLLNPNWRCAETNIDTGASLQAASPHNIYLLSPDERNLLWEWIQLEAIFVALSGQRVYDQVLFVVKAYLEQRDFVQTLQGQNATLKALIVYFVCNLNTQGTLASQLACDLAWTQHVLPAIQNLKENAHSQQAFKTVAQHIGPPFALACTFFDCSLTPFE